MGGSLRVGCLLATMCADNALELWVREEPRVAGGPPATAVVALPLQAGSWALRRVIRVECGVHSLLYAASLMLVYGSCGSSSRARPGGLQDVSEDRWGGVEVYVAAGTIFNDVVVWKTPVLPLHLSPGPNHSINSHLVSLSL